MQDTIHQTAGSGVRPDVFEFPHRTITTPLHPINPLTALRTETRSAGILHRPAESALGTRDIIGVFTLMSALRPALTEFV